jgi:hypothetical protein
MYKSPGSAMQIGAGAPLSSVHAMADRPSNRAYSDLERASKVAVILFLLSSFIHLFLGNVPVAIVISAVSC